MESTHLMSITFKLCEPLLLLKIQEVHCMWWDRFSYKLGCQENMKTWASFPVTEASAWYLYMAEKKKAKQHIHSSDNKEEHYFLLSNKQNYDFP